MLKRPCPVYCYFFSFLGLITVSFASAQQPVFNHFSTIEGLPSPETYMAMQDSKGYLWISTDHGVCRFDGYSFKVFTTSDGLNGNTVFGTYEDRLGRIWFFTFEDGISYYQDGKIVNLFENRDMSMSGALSVPYSFAMDEGDTLWMAMRYNYHPNYVLKVHPSGYHEVDSMTGAINGGFLKKLNSGDHIISGFSKNHGEGNAVLSLLDEGGGILRFSRQEYGHKYYGVSSFQRPNGDVLFVYMGALALWSEGSVRLLAELNRKTNLGLCEDRNGNVWVALAKGGVLVFPNGNFRDPPKLWLRDHYVSWISEDAEGGIWVTTLDDGVFYTPSPEIRALPSEVFFEGGRMTEDLAGKGDTILASTKDGVIARIVYKKNASLSVEAKKLYTRGIGHLQWPEGGSPLVYGSDSGLGSWSSLDINTLEVTSTGPKQGSVVAQFNDSLNCSIKRSGSLIFWRAKTQEVLREINTGKRYNWRCHYLSGDTLWIGGMKGLYRFVFGGDSVEHILPEKELLRVRIRNIGKINNAVLLATSGHGLVILGGKEPWSISAADGLPSDICNDVNVDDNGDIWLSTNRGISRISGLDPSAALFSIQNYDFLSSSISQRVHKVHLEGDMIWALYDGGIIYFDKSEYQQAEPPPVYIDALEVNHKLVDISGNVQYPWNENNIRIGFTGISYRSADKLRYKYRMIGVDTTWYITTDRSVTYPHLNSGQYRFEIHAQNAEGNWSNKHASVQFAIMDPWWNTWWFMTAEIILAALLILGLPYLYLRRVKRRGELEGKVNQLKLQALQAQMNPHFIFNVLGAIQSFIVSRDTDAAEEYLSSFADLVRSTLDHSTRTWVSLHEEMKAVNTYLTLERMRFEMPFEFKLQAADDIDTRTLEVPTMMLQPFVENAVIHGIYKSPRKGIIEVYIEKEGKELKCTISDNGVGRPLGNVMSNKGRGLHRSFGINITKERLQLHSAKNATKKSIEYFDLKDDNGQAKGTKVVVLIPYNPLKLTLENNRYGPIDH